MTTEAIFHHRHSGRVFDDAPGLFPPESGPLSIKGEYFYNGDALAQIRCISAFLLFLRYCRGEDITPDLRWYRAFGFNCVRLFGPLPWKETPDYRVEMFRFDLLPAFFILLQAHGLRCNWSLAHYKDPGLQAHVQRWYDIAQDFWCVVAEVVNEPHVGKTKPDPIETLTGIDTHGVLTSYGYYKETLDGQDGWPPVKHFGTVHTPRDAAWARKFRIAKGAQDATHIPWWNDEHAKIVEPGFDYPGGKNDPTLTPRETVWYAGGCYLWSSAYTYHCEEGKWGRTPTPGMLQYTVAEALRDHVFIKIGPEWQTGEYNHSENHDSPVDDVNVNGRPIWTYTSFHPQQNKALSIRYGPVPLKAVNGWRIVDSWLDDTIAQLER